MKLTTYILAMFMAISPVYAQDFPCWSREDFLQIMQANEATNFGYGLDEVGNLSEIWVRPDHRWMYVVTVPSQMTCMINHGIMWEEGVNHPQGVPG